MSADPRILEFDPENDGPEEARRAYRRELEAGDRSDESDRSGESPPPGEEEEKGAPDPGEEDQPLSPVPGNDVENSRRFAATLRDRALYCPEIETWLLWRPRRGWEWDRAGGIMELAKRHALSLLKAGAALPDPEENLRAVRRANAFCQKARLDALLYLTRSDPRVVAPRMSLDADPWRAGVEGGSVDLRTGVFSPPTPALLLTRRLGAAWDPEAECPAWRGFLERVIPCPELRRFLQASAGYTLTGHAREHCFWFLHGAGSNGKSTFVETLHALYHDYGRTAAESLITRATTGSGPNVEMAELPGVRFLAGSEVSEGVRLNESLIKGLTGGDTMSGEAKYCSPFNFKPALKFWMFGNHRPVITGTDLGIWRRVRLIPFLEHIPEEAADKSLPERLRGELPGILNWALAGLRDWRENGFIIPDAVRLATAGYREASDTLGAFLRENVQHAPGCSLTAKEVYARYREWCEEEGIRHPQSAMNFNARLSDRGYLLTRSCGARKWRELGWVPENPALCSAGDGDDDDG